MDRSDALPETAAQWMEHSEAWRYAHLDQAPSANLRRLAIEEHAYRQRMAEATQPTGDSSPSQVWAGLSPLARQMIVVLIVVLVAVTAFILR